jgi:uncharacterized membrane protein
MVDTSVVIIASFLLAFKAILIEGSEVAIISLALISQLGKRNIVFGVLLGGIGSIGTFLIVRTIFVTFSDVRIAQVNIIDIVTAIILLYFSSRFLRGFIKYAFRGKSFASKMQRIEDEIVVKAKQQGGDQPVQSFSWHHSLPVVSITLTEGFEASLILAAAGYFNFLWTITGALISILTLVIVCAFSYKYLVRAPRWLLDMIAGFVLLSFGILFLITGIFGL